MISEDPADTSPPSDPSVDPFATDISATEPAPTTLGGYRLISQLGRGGMGTVYEAEPITGGARVAMKTLQAGSAASLARLKAEFRIVADLAHPNLVQLGELNTTDREPFFTMEIVRGKAFDDYVRSSFESAAAAPSLPYSEQRLRESLRQLADGLVALHEAGLIHRDIKPSNVMVSSEGRVVILDMGLAVETDDAKFRNSQREFAGTPYFMAPEQARGETMTPSGDWYAVGIMLFEALTGERAFQSRRLDLLLKEKTADERPSPRDVLSTVPDDLSQLCYELLRPLPQARPSGMEVLKRLHGHSESLPETSIWIGRERELQVFRDSWRRVRKGEPQVVLVSGPSGMGKTALVDHFLARLRREESVVVLRGRCYENEAVAYRGFDSVVDSLATYLRRLPSGEVERVLPLDTDMLCQLFPVMGEVAAVANRRSRLHGRRDDPRERRQKGIAALRELLCRLASFVSLVIFVDDLQQGDDDTAGLFRELLRRDQSPMALFLGTYRNEDADTNECLRQIRRSQLQPTEQLQLSDQIELSVDKLSPDDSVRLASSLLLRHLLTQSNEVQRIASEADGDPLFIRMLAEHRIRYHQAASDSKSEGKVPWTLATVIEDRVKSLAIHERIALELLAAAGRPVDARDLESVVGSDSHSLGLIRSLRIKRMIRRLGDRERIEPFHDKIKETVLGLISPQRLARYCLSLAERIDGNSDKRDVEFLANLYRRGGERQKAGQCYEAAAAIADSTFAFYRAIECYGYAIDLLQPTGRHEKALRKGLGDALANASRSAEAAEQYLKAAAVDDSVERPKLQQLAALRYLTSGHVEEGIESLRKVLAHHGLPWPSNRMVAVIGLLTRSTYLRLRGLRPRPSGGENKPQDREKLDACWAAAAGLSLVDPLRGSYYIAETLCRSLRMGSSATLPRDLAAYMGQVAIGGSRSRLSTYRVLRACREISSQHRDPYTKAMQFMARGIAALLRGQWSASLSCCDAATRWLSDPSCHGPTWEINTARTFALWSLQYQGNLVEVSRRQPELLRVAKESDDLFATLNFGTQVMAHLQLAGDQPSESLRRLEEDRSRLSDRGFFIQHHNYVLAKTFTLIYQHRGPEALATIDGQWQHYRHEFLSYIQQVRIDHQQVRVRALIAAAAQGHDRDACLRRARQLIGSLRRERAAWATALAEAFHAACDQLEGRHDEARQGLYRAKQLLDRAGMRLFATAAQQHLARRDDAGLAVVDSTWRTLGVACGERMTQMMIPGFEYEVLRV
jgi:serine/threonine protein kinase/tetratricopeptide (TPR) repeat protein